MMQKLPAECLPGLSKWQKDNFYKHKKPAISRLFCATALHNLFAGKSSFMLFLHGMKKWLGYILSVYILFCAVVPCTVFDACEEEILVAQTTTESPEEDCNNCSPFSICAACQSVANTVEQMIIELPVFYHSSFYMDFYPSSKSEYHTTHFQPPRTA